MSDDDDGDGDSEDIPFVECVTCGLRSSDVCARNCGHDLCDDCEQHGDCTRESDMSDERNNPQIEAAIALVGQIGPDVGSVWRHRKGGVYRVMCCAIQEADMVPVVVYHLDSPKGMQLGGRMIPTWTRPLTEFTDGRFTLIHGGNAS